ncbi:MAG: D-2-hydroxyacid dehydrogenase [Acidobacteria bacterium]|nr:D-2-hydroxyacid dehydrogenase [Acidobacteriota bacterium]
MPADTRTLPTPKPTLVILTAPGTPEPYNLAHLRQLADVELVHADELPSAIKGAEVLLLWDFFSSALRQAWPFAKKLKWVHVAAAGVDAILFDEFAASDIPLTNAAGVFDVPIAEFALASVLAHDKQLYVSHELAKKRVWKHRETTLTRGSRALIVGTGGIGRTIAALFKAVGMEVRGVGRTARENDPDFGTVVASPDLAAHVGWADHVIAVAPLTDQTRKMINSSVLAAMKPTAQLINVGRGQLVDEDALIHALRAGTIASATLDVVTEEPLKVSSPLFSLENVHLSAHMSGDVAGWRNTLAQQFAANLQRFMAGEPLAHPVDKQLGYVTRG